MSRKPVAYAVVAFYAFCLAALFFETVIAPRNVSGEVEVSVQPTAEGYRVRVSGYSGCLVGVRFESGAELFFRPPSEAVVPYSMGQPVLAEALIDGYMRSEAAPLTPYSASEAHIRVEVRNLLGHIIAETLSNPPLAVGLGAFYLLPAAALAALWWRPERRPERKPEKRPEKRPLKASEKAGGN